MKTYKNIDEYNKLRRLQLEQYIRSARKSFLEFCKFCWMGPGHFISGPHIEGLCKEIDIAIEKYEKGESTNLIVSMPFRHSKTSCVSKLLPAYFLAREAKTEPSVLLSGYGSSLVQDASQDCKRIISQGRFVRLFDNVKLDANANRVDNWRIAGSAGRIVAVGLGGALAGRGYHLGVLDDYCKSREEAESATYRQNTWQAFSNDFLTRRQNPSITLITATRWHTDDLVGRILAAQSKNKDFPQFKSVFYPARNKDGTFLWESFLGREWYLNHYATLSPYEAAGLLDCDPEIKEGGMFNVESFKKITSTQVKIEDVHSAIRFWDRAATQGGGCFTAGVLMLRMKDKRYIVYDVCRGQWATDERERKIKECADSDRNIFKNVKIGLEQEPGSGGLDSIRFTKQNLAGHCVVIDKVTGSKEIRANPYSSQVNGGNVTLVDSLWLQPYVGECASFPSGKYKDMVDASSGAFNQLSLTGSSGSGGVFNIKTTY